ncbi:hypothetical protein Glove_410g98 [Diversispora epigaea]|uniref:Uncharacterized protein n=1 Tax=Diversispora epigaea TaxID=1348612 RepID=A0A397H621_9GLOM|nr:hypothetical protein Glove_410g98 [Diversispora epigaea]
MKKNRKINISLISPGVLVEKLHYGPYSCYWWLPLLNSDSKEITTYFPIRVKQKIKAILRNLEFTVTMVIGNKDNDSSLPGYMCQCEDIIEIANDPTNAISNVYFKIFATKTRYSGSLIMGWNDDDIINKLSEDIPFIPRSFSLEKIKIFVYGVEYLTCMDWFYAGPGYKSSLFHRFQGNRQALFVSKIEKTSCILKIYQDLELKITITSKNPIDIWKNSKTIEKFNGNQLFGIDNYTIQSLNQNQKKLTCSPQEWKNNSIMKSLFDFYLKLYVLPKSQIIWDLGCQNAQITSIWDLGFGISAKNTNYNLGFGIWDFGIWISNLGGREMCAWQTFLRAVGANNITPSLWSHEEQYQFWSKSDHPKRDYALLTELYQMGFLVKDISTPTTPIKDSTQTFWQCFNYALEDNKKNRDGKRQSRKHTRTSGYGAPPLDKPIFHRVKFTTEQLQQFELFFSTKEHVNMSSYKTDNASGLPVLYLQDHKKALWDRFHEQYPNGMQRTSFITKLSGKRFIYKEDLGGLCSECNECGYQVFANIEELIKINITDLILRNELIANTQNL